MIALDVLTELVGTLFFVSIVIVTGGQWWAVGAALAATIWLGSAAGCHSNHFNPAVSVALFARGAMPAWRCASYVAAQVAGGLAAMYLIRRWGLDVTKWLHSRGVLA